MPLTKDTFFNVDTVFTHSDIMALGPCYDAAERGYRSSRWKGTLAEYATEMDMRVPFSDQMWAISGLVGVWIFPTRPWRMSMIHRRLQNRLLAQLGVDGVDSAGYFWWRAQLRGFWGEYRMDRVDGRLSTLWVDREECVKCPSQYVKDLARYAAQWEVVDATV